MEEELFDPGWREPSEEEVRALHEAVLMRVRRKAAQQRAWKWCTAGAAAAAVAAFCLIHIALRPEIKPKIEIHTPAPLAAAIVPTPAAIAAPVRFAPRRHHRSAPGLRAAALITRPNQPPVIKLTTSDPNVVILLVSNEHSSTQRSLSNE